MGLVRKKCKGSAGLLEPRHGTLIFSDQNDVDNFVDNYQKEVKHNEVHVEDYFRYLQSTFV